MELLFSIFFLSSFLKLFNIEKNKNFFEFTFFKQINRSFYQLISSTYYRFGIFGSEKGKNFKKAILQEKKNLKKNPHFFMFSNYRIFFKNFFDLQTHRISRFFLSSYNNSYYGICFNGQEIHENFAISRKKLIPMLLNFYNFFLDNFLFLNLVSLHDLKKIYLKKLQKWNIENLKNYFVFEKNKLYSSSTIPGKIVLFFKKFFINLEDGKVVFWISILDNQENSKYFPLFFFEKKINLNKKYYLKKFHDFFSFISF